MGLFYLVSEISFCQRALYQSYLKVTALACGNLLNLLGQHCTVSEQTIHSSRFSVVVSQGCDAVESSYFLCAAILAFPSPLLKKLPGLVMGIILLQPLNLLRLVTLFLIGVSYPALFDTAHTEIWPAIFIMAVMFFWIVWVKWIGAAAARGLHVRL